MTNELNLPWVPNFIALRIYFHFGPNFPGMRGLILVLMSTVRYLTEILNFLVVTWWLLHVTYWLLLITACYLVVTTAKCLLPGGYRSLLLVPTFSINVGKHLCQSLFFNNVPGLRPAILLKKRLWHRCFSVNFMIFLRKTFLQNTSGPLLLNSETKTKIICLINLNIKR